MVVSLLIELICGFCGGIFHLCRFCYRGQSYCCKECRKAGYREKHGEAERQYRATEKGRLSRREAEKRRRKRSEIPCLVKAGLQRVCVRLGCLAGPSPGEETPSEVMEVRCGICGRAGISVDRFPRRDYARPVLNPDSS